MRIEKAATDGKKLPKLTPAQASAKEALIQAVRPGSVLALGGETGRGKSTVLRQIHHEVEGAVLRIADLLHESAQHHPLSLEERMFGLVLSAMKQHQTVIVDDFQLLQDTLCCNHFYPRMRWLEAPSLALCDYALEERKTLIFSYGMNLPAAIYERGVKATIPRFRVEDYEVLLGNFLGAAAATLDFSKVYRFAPKLNGHQLQAACEWLLRSETSINTDAFIEYLRSQRLTSNVDLEEVQTSRT